MKEQNADEARYLALQARVRELEAQGAKFTCRQRSSTDDFLRHGRVFLLHRAPPDLVECFVTFDGVTWACCEESRTPYGQYDESTQLKLFEKIAQAIKDETGR